jgi:hypothetical protein
MRQIDESKPLSAEDRQWLTDWGRFDTIRRIDEANGVDDTEPAKTIAESDLRALLQSHGIDAGDDPLDTLKGVLSGTNVAPAEQPNRFGDSAAHVAPDPSDDDAPSGSDALGEPDGDGSDEDDEEGDSYADWTVDDLKDELGARELSKSGNKPELIARLEESDAAGYKA